MQKPKHVFLDLDKTLTMSRSELAPEHRDDFDALCNRSDVVVVTGGMEIHIKEQVTSRFDGKYFMLAQSGNDAINKDGVVLWREELGETQIAVINEAISALKQHFNAEIIDETDLVEYRGAQVGYSVLGYHADRDAKYAFDPDDPKRAAALKTMPEIMEKLRNAGVDVTPAGTTSFNFIPAGKHKGFNIRRLIAHEEWLAEDCLYIGDALFPGGNDESVIGIIPTQAVKDPNDTFSFIKSFLLS